MKMLYDSCLQALTGGELLVKGLLNTLDLPFSDQAVRVQPDPKLRALLTDGNLRYHGVFQKAAQFVIVDVHHRKGIKKSFCHINPAIDPAHTSGFPESGPPEPSGQPLPCGSTVLLLCRPRCRYRLPLPHRDR